MKTARIVAVSDSHCQHTKLLLPEGDFLLHAGDFSHKGRTAECLDFLKWFDTQPHKHKVFIAGNHELGVEQNPDIFRAMVKEVAPSCHYLNEQSIELDGWKIFGSPWTPHFYNWAFNAHRGPEIQAHWDKIPNDTEILISHGPPHGVLDLVMDGSHQGCRDLKKTIENRLKNLQIHCYGHLHLEGAQSTVQDGVIYVNAACVDEEYKLRGEIQVIDLFK
jgi:Icc-related predicted phosphoesterase